MPGPRERRESSASLLGRERNVDSIVDVESNSLWYKLSLLDDLCIDLSESNVGSDEQLSESLLLSVLVKSFLVCWSSASLFKNSQLEESTW